MPNKVAVRGPKVQVCLLDVVADLRRSLQVSDESAKRTNENSPAIHGWVNQERMNPKSAKRTTANSPAIHRWVSKPKGPRVRNADD
jgi:hypothetical protein